MNGLEITTGLDVLLLCFRCAVGIVFLAHGYNHLWGPGGLDGTARWFAGLGFRPPRLHALMSGVVELAIAACLILGACTPLACAALVGTMVVAGWTDHRPNGFFMFRNGYEYVLVLGITAVAMAAVGPGTLSFDEVVGIVDYRDPTSPGLLGLSGALIAAVAGLVGGTLVLTLGWRRPAPVAPAETP